MVLVVYILRKSLYPNFRELYLCCAYSKQKYFRKLNIHPNLSDKDIDESNNFCDIC